MTHLNIAAALFGSMAVASAVAWGLMGRRRGMLAGQMVQAASFAVHFALLGAYSGAAMCGLSVLQLAFASVDRSRLSTIAFWATTPAIVGLAVATWTGWASACATLGLALVSLGRWQRDCRRLRLCFIVAALVWGVHNLIVESPYGLVTDFFIFTTNAWRLRRNARASGETPAVAIGRRR